MAHAAPMADTGGMELLEREADAPNRNAAAVRAAKLGLLA
jgi:hypothetical protein